MRTQGVYYSLVEGNSPCNAWPRLIKMAPKRRALAPWHSCSKLGEGESGGIARRPIAESFPHLVLDSSGSNVHNDVERYLKEVTV